MTALIEAIAWRDMALVLVLVMALALAGFIKGWWVVGRRYDEMKKERDYFRDRFFDTLGVAEKATDIAVQEVGL